MVTIKFVGESSDTIIYYKKTKLERGLMQAVTKILDRHTKKEDWEKKREREEKLRREELADFYKKLPRLIGQLDSTDPTHEHHSSSPNFQFQYDRKWDGQRTISKQLWQMALPTEILRMHQAFSEIIKPETIPANQITIDITNGETKLFTDFKELSVKEGNPFNENKYAVVDKKTGAAVEYALKLDEPTLEALLKPEIPESLLDAMSKLPESQSHNTTIILRSRRIKLPDNTELEVGFTNKWQQRSPYIWEFTLFDGRLNVTYLDLKMKPSSDLDKNFVAELVKRLFYEESAFHGDPYFRIFGKNVEKPASISVRLGTATYTLLHKTAEVRDGNAFHASPELIITSGVPIRKKNVKTLLRTLKREDICATTQ